MQTAKLETHSMREFSLYRYEDLMACLSVTAFLAMATVFGLILSL